MFTNRSYYLIRTISANHPVCSQKGCNWWFRKKILLERTAAQMQQWDAPPCSRLFLLFHWAKGTEQPPRTANAASFEAGEEEKSHGATQKNLPDIRLLPKGALKRFQAGDWIEGWNCVPGRNKSALDETWAMLQDYKALKRQCYIYIGWRNINCLEDFCSPKKQWKIWRIKWHIQASTTLCLS